MTTKTDIEQEREDFAQVWRELTGSFPNRSFYPGKTFKGKDAEMAWRLWQARAALQEQPAPADAWQPIETAPKYTEVLVWREDSGPFIAKFTDPYEVIPVEEMERENMEFPDDFEEWYSDAYGWQEGSERPTHWMPLPAGPDARRRVEGEADA